MDTVLRYLATALDYATAAVLSLVLGGVRLILCR
jgi:hypothetical protein